MGQKANMTGVVLAGGRSKRMGIDKATLKINDTLLIEYPIKILDKLFERILVVTNERLSETLESSLSKYESLNVIQDIYPDHGALGGIYTALSYSETPYIFVTACDMPFLNGDFIKYMLEFLDNAPDVIVPESTGGLETLHAIYSKGTADLIMRKIFKNENKIKDLFPLVNVRYIPSATIKTFDKEEKMFKNINTPRELREYLG